MVSAAPALKACPCCGLVQALPTFPASARDAARTRARCARCGSTVVSGRSSHASSWTASAALAALILYPLAISLPIMELERFGHRTSASIWTGSVGLLSDGHLFVGGVVLLSSIVLPLGKLLSLFALTAGRRRFSKQQRATTYRIVEVTGRWGMLDVLLIAVLVAWIKVGDLVQVTAGPAAVAFTACVLLSLLASASFDPHQLWDEGRGSA